MQRLRGFSLVELSIVLVILGLLTGGILAGQSLIRASEMRAITSEYQRYLSATHTFRDKYMALPGDMSNAVSFWNRLVNQAWCLPTSGATVTTPGACNGDASGAIAYPAAASQSGEVFQYWRHLALAGLIEGNYSGLAGPNDRTEINTTNAPTSRSGSSNVWGVRYISTGMFSNWVQANGFVLGVPNPTANYDGDDAVLQPSEMWGIDTKLDDGKPGYGMVQSYNATHRALCVSTDDPATSVYLLTGTTIACTLNIRM